MSRNASSLHAGDNDLQIVSMMRTGSGKYINDVVLACIVLVVAAPIYRAAHAPDELIYMYGYLPCFDAIAMGALAALLNSAALSADSTQACEPDRATHVE